MNELLGSCVVYLMFGLEWAIAAFLIWTLVDILFSEKVN